MRLLLLVFLALQTNLFSDALSDEEVHMDQFATVVISLGCNCDPALFMRENQLRSAAFPFDWCITSYTALYSHIASDFTEFLKQTNLISAKRPYLSDEMEMLYKNLGYNPTVDSPHWVLDQTYGMIFNHDFSRSDPVTINSEYAANKTKYTRRSNRFIEIMNSNKKIFLIRYFEITKIQAISLRDLLSSKFPSSDFTLIVINSSDEFEEDWNLFRIKNFHSKKDLWMQIQKYLYPCRNQ